MFGCPELVRLVRRVDLTDEEREQINQVLQDRSISGTQEWVNILKVRAGERLEVPAVVRKLMEETQS